MKDYKIFAGLILLIAIIFMANQGNDAQLNTGDFTFISFNAANDGFEIIALTDLPPNDKIHFTDSEWNGNHFGADESDLIWNTGEETILKGSLVKFQNLSTNPAVSNGTLKNSMRISKNKEAIFAYLGEDRMPTRFIAAVANDQLAYGTLINTGLREDFSALTFPRGTNYASYQGSTIFNDPNEFIAALNTLSNYKLE